MNKVSLSMGLEEYMDDAKPFRAIDLYDWQDGNKIEEEIIEILKGNKLSLSQTCGIFNHIIHRIADRNIVNL